MTRFPKVLLALGVGVGIAACNGDTRDDTTIRDTTITTVPDTILIERTTTIDVDTVRDPNLDRDTVPGTRTP